MRLSLQRILNFMPRKKQPPPLNISEALARANRDPAKAPEFFRSLLSQTLFSFKSLNAQGESAQFLDQSGEPFVAVFSEVAFVPKDVPSGYVVESSPGHRCLTEMRGHRVVLNPGQEAFKVFSKENVDTILDLLLTVKEKPLATSTIDIPHDTRSDFQSQKALL